MNIEEFNKKFERFQIFEKSSSNERYFSCKEFCPSLDDYYHILMPLRWGFKVKNQKEYPFERINVPENLVKQCLNPPKSIIICEEKHCTNYYDASSTEIIGKTCVFLVKERHEIGYYEFNEIEEPVKPKYQPEEIDDPELVRTIKMQWVNYNSAYLTYKRQKKYTASVEDVIKNNDYLKALHLLQDRSAFEYEGFEMEILTDIGS